MSSERWYAGAADVPIYQLDLTPLTETDLMAYAADTEEDT